MPYIFITGVSTGIGFDAMKTLIQHGYHDPVVPVQQSIKFAAALEQAAGKEKVHLDVFENHIMHADPYFESDANLEVVYAFLDKHLKR